LAAKQTWPSEEPREVTLWSVASDPLSVNGHWAAWGYR
jgi:hypothetical protein